MCLMTAAVAHSVWLLPEKIKIKKSEKKLFSQKHEAGVYATDAGIDLLRFARHGLEQRVRAQRVKVRARKVKRARARDARLKFAN
jgi:hypothetical protein